MSFPINSVFKSTLLLGASVLMALAAAETFLRLFPSLMPESAQLRVHWQETTGGQSLKDPYFGIIEPPYEHVEVKRGTDFKFTFTTDEHGFRNPSPWPTHADIVVLGDSLAFGYGVNDDQAWTTLLQGALPDSRVINLAVTGTGPPQYLRYYEVFGAPLRPKVVFFGLFPGNDLYDTVRFERWLHTSDSESPPGSANIISGLFEKSYLWWFLRESNRALRSRFFGETIDLPDGGRLELAPAIYANQAADAQPQRPAFRSVLNVIERTRELAHANNSAFVVLLFPTKEEVYLPLYDKPTPQLVAPFVTVFKKRGIPYIDLTPYFQARARNETLFFRIDGHPNAEGYRLVANVVLEHLKRNKERYGLRDRMSD